MAGAERAGPLPVRARRGASRPTWAQIDLAAVRHNARLLRHLAAPAELCAVVKADGYGHGAVAVGRAALEGGARWLAVATVEEGVELRDARVAAPVLVLSEPPIDAMDEVVARSLTPTLYSLAGVEAAEHAASRRGGMLDVHVKVDTGMHRVGADPAGLGAVLSALHEAGHLRYAALWTHLAVADGTSEEDRAFTEEQLGLFSRLRRETAALAGDPPLAHAANSAAAIACPSSRLDLVRCGIALYGSLPSPALAGPLEAALAEAGGGLRPVMSLRAEISCTRHLEAGARPSYGRLRPLPVGSLVAAVPIGYADGVPRRYFSEGGTVLIGGRHRPLAGTVTMDQIVVDCGPDAQVSVGDEVVLIGEQGAEHITAWDWAETLGTISYEVLSRIGPRVARVEIDDDADGDTEPADGGEVAAT